MRILKWLLMSVLLIVVLAAISKPSHKSSTPSSDYRALSPADRTAADKTQAIVDRSIASAKTHPVGYLSRARIGTARWPLTVSSGVVRCDDGSSVVFRSNGVNYAVNGTAKTEHPELPPIEQIWRHESGQLGRLGLRVSISPVIDRGLQLC